MKQIFALFALLLCLNAFAQTPHRAKPGSISFLSGGTLYYTASRVFGATGTQTSIITYSRDYPFEKWRFKSLDLRNATVVCVDDSIVVVIQSSYKKLSPNRQKEALQFLIQWLMDENRRLSKLEGK